MDDAGSLQHAVVLDVETETDAQVVLQMLQGWNDEDLIDDALMQRIELTLQSSRNAFYLTRHAKGRGMFALREMSTELHCEQYRDDIGWESVLVIKDVYYMYGAVRTTSFVMGSLIFIVWVTIWMLVLLLVFIAGVWFEWSNGQSRPYDGDILASSFEFVAGLMVLVVMILYLLHLMRYSNKRTFSIGTAF